MLRDIDKFYLHQKEPARSVLEALRKIILKSDPEITEAWKYRMPFFCYKGKMCCYLWLDKNSGHPYLGIVEGNRLNHPALEQGNRARMKILTLNPHKDLELKTIHAILTLTLDLYRKGIVKTTKKQS